MPLKTISIGNDKTNDRINISPIALGSVELVEFYKHLPTTGDEIRSIAQKLIETAFDNGINCFDTADMYAMGVHEKILGEALAKLISSRTNAKDKIIICTKVGIVRDLQTGTFLGIDCSPEYIKKQCIKSLKRLAIDHIDIYFLHRPDLNTKIEDSIDALIDLKNSGKIKHFGLSEFPPELIELAQKHAISKGHQISVIQNGYSILNRKIETDETIKICKKYGIIIFAHSPLANGLIPNTQDLKDAAQIAHQNQITEEKLNAYKKGDQRRAFAELNEINISENQKIADQLTTFSEKMNCSRAQFSLAFIKHKSQELDVPIIPIIGTKTPQHVIENIQAYEIDLPELLYLEACNYFPPNILKGGGIIDELLLKEVFEECHTRLSKRGLWPLLHPIN